MKPHQDQPGSMPNRARRFTEGADPENFAKPVKLRNPRAALTADQQSLAAGWVRLAFSLAKRYVSAYPNQAHYYNSAAELALVEAAGRYDPASDATFGTYAHRCIVLALRTAHRQVRPKGFRRAGQDDQAPAIESLGSFDVPATATATAQSDHTDVIGTILARMEPRLAEVLRRRHIEQKTQVEIAAEMGCTKQNVHILEHKALARAREIAERYNLTG